MSAPYCQLLSAQLQLWGSAEPLDPSWLWPVRPASLVWHRASAGIPALPLCPCFYCLLLGASEPVFLLPPFLCVCFPPRAVLLQYKPLAIPSCSPNFPARIWASRGRGSSLTGSGAQHPSGCQPPPRRASAPRGAPTLQQVGAGSSPLCSARPALQKGCWASAEGCDIAWGREGGGVKELPPAPIRTKRVVKPSSGPRGGGGGGRRGDAASLPPSLPPSPRPEERAGGGWQPGHGGLGAAERCGLRPPPVWGSRRGGECSAGVPVLLGGYPSPGVEMGVRGGAAPPAIVCRPVSGGERKEEDGALRGSILDAAATPERVGPKQSGSPSCAGDHRPQPTLAGRKQMPERERDEPGSWSRTANTGEGLNRENNVVKQSQISP